MTFVVLVPKSSPMVANSRMTSVALANTPPPRRFPSYGGVARTPSIIRIVRNRVRNYADWFSDVAVRACFGSSSRVRMSSTEVIRSRAQSNRGGSEEQCTLTYRK
jgi:hypothetical protein